MRFVCFCVSRFVACGRNYDWRQRKTRLWRRLLNFRVCMFVKSAVKVFCVLLQIPDVLSDLIHTRLKRNPLGNWAVLFFSGQKPCTRITSSISIIAPFFTLFEGYRSNKLYEITPTKRLLWELEKTNFKSFKFHKMKSYAWRFTRVFSMLVIFENYFLGLP